MLGRIRQAQATAYLPRRCTCDDSYGGTNVSQHAGRQLIFATHRLHCDSFACRGVKTMLLMLDGWLCRSARTSLTGLLMRSASTGGHARQLGHGAGSGAPSLSEYNGEI